MSRIGSEISDLQILPENDRAYIVGHQNAAVDLRFNNAPSAKPFEMLDLQEIRAGITAKQIVIQRRRQREAVGPAIPLPSRAC